MLRFHVAELDDKALTQSNFVLIIEKDGKLIEGLMYPIKPVIHFVKSKNLDNIIKPVNLFFETINDSKLEEDYINLIIKLTKETYSKLLKNEIDFDAYITIINQEVEKFVEKHKLIERILGFVIQAIKLPDLSMAGTRPQDDIEKTFYAEDYHQLHALVVFVKLFFPLFSVMYNFLTGKTDEKIIRFTKLFENVIEKYFKFIDQKLEIYIERQIEKLDIDLKFAYRCYTPEYIYCKIITSIYFKKFLKIDFFEPDFNIMSVIFGTINNEIKQMKFKDYQEQSVKERFYSFEGDDEDSLSFLELDTFNFKESLDLPILLGTIIEEAQIDLAKEAGIDINLFLQIKDYYKRHILTITHFDKYICSLFFRDIAESTYIQYLDYDQLTNLISYIQIFLVLSGAKPNMIMALTLSKTGKKHYPTDIDLKFKATGFLCPEYEELLKYYEHIEQTIIPFTKNFNKIIDEFITYNFKPIIPDALKAFYESVRNQPMEIPNEFQAEPDLLINTIKLTYYFFLKWGWIKEVIKNDRK